MSNLPVCDCHTICGDDPDVDKGLVQPCKGHHSQKKPIVIADCQRTCPHPRKAILKLKRHNIELELTLDTDGKYYISSEAL